MIAVTSAVELEPHVGKVLGTSDWLELSFEQIANFGTLTRDCHWMHVDRSRAQSEGPFGDVIAHGFLLLSLVTGLSNQCYSIKDVTRWTNYGLDRVRFTSPALPFDAVRLALTLKGLDLIADGFRLTLKCELQLRDRPRPALVADWLVLVAEDRP
jgi:acyl dehydratase